MTFRKMIAFGILNLLLCFNVAMVADTNRMLPIKQQKNYYNNEADIGHEHISFKGAARFLVSSMFQPQKWIKAIASKFYTFDENNALPTAVEVLKPLQTVPVPSSIKPVITWVGHSTFLIQMNGFNILTDPIFGPIKVGPFVLKKRCMKPGIALKDLPPIHAIVISHNHSDHTDADTLTALAKKYNPTVYVPKGNKKLLESMGFTTVVERMWWENSTLTHDGRTITFTCLPAFHWSIRFSLDSYRKSLWGSWMMSANSANIYFAGDTAIGKHFKQIGNEFPAIDIALMPIGPTCKGENIHHYEHIDAQEAVDMFIDLGARCFVPMHYGTFFGGDAKTLQYPLQKLPAYWESKQAQLRNKTLFMARCGKEFGLAKNGTCVAL